MVEQFPNVMGIVVGTPKCQLAVYVLKRVFERWMPAFLIIGCIPQMKCNLFPVHITGFEFVYLSRRTVAMYPRAESLKLVLIFELNCRYDAAKILNEPVYEY